MKGITIFKYLYNKAFYAYIYTEVYIWQKWSQLDDLRRNMNWVKKHGPYTGDK